MRGIYRSLAHPDLVMIDKENGGKADAINAGINAARYPLVCVIDADSLLEEHSLSRAVLPFIEDPDTIAAGGIVRIANGCRIERGRVTDVRLPRSHLAMFQTVEYLLRLVAYGVLENCRYRQLATWWRIVGVVDYFRGKRDWGTMKRKGFAAHDPRVRSASVRSVRL